MGDQQPHVVLVAPFGLAPKATTSTRALPLGAALVARGWRVTLLIPPWDDPARSGQTWVDTGVTVRHIALPQRLSTAGIVHRLRSAIRELSPDCIHLFKPKGYGGLAVLGLERRIPLIVDTDDWEGPGGWNDQGLYSAPAQRLFTWQERDLARRAAAVTVASQTLAQQARQFGLSQRQITYLPNGITHQRHGSWATDRQQASARRTTLGLDAAPTVLLYTRFVEFAPERPIAILQAVRQTVPEARLLLVGHGLHGEEDQFFAAAQAAHLSDAVTALRWVDWSYLPATLACGDVAILPYDDTLINRAKCSVKTLDLMAAARPIVADPIGQNRAYLVAGESGLFPAANSPAAFGATVADLLRNSGQRTALGRNAEARVWAEFAWDRLVDRVESAYQHAIAGSRPR